jgi:predicted phosphodiesterase
MNKRDLSSQERRLLEVAIDQAKDRPDKDYLGRRELRQVTGCTWREARRVAKVARELVETKEPTPTAKLSKHPKFNPQHPTYRMAAIEILKKGVALRELSEGLGSSEDEALDMVRSLKSSGWMVREVEGIFELQDLLPSSRVVMKDFSRVSDPITKIGVISDTHIGSKSQRLDMNEMAYEKFANEGITDVFHAGNIIDGYRESINADEVLFRNCTDQCYYLMDMYPEREGITTHFITGKCHEGWYQKKIGLEIGEYIQMVAEKQGRDDLKFLGHLERDVEFAGKGGSVIMRILHPAGGSSYAQSYKPQKIVASYQGGEKPNILLVGHFHKAGWFFPRNVHVVMAGCGCDQTSFMRSRHIQAHVGFFIVEFSQDNNGAVSQFTPRFFPFYDKGYHFNRSEWEMAIWEGGV